MDRGKAIDLLKRRGANDAEINRLLASFGSIKAAMESRESDWRNGLEYILDVASSKSIVEAKNVTAELVRIDEDGFLTAKCKHKDKTYVATLRCDTQTYNVSFACECMARKQQNCCAHGVALVQYFENEMRNLDSPVREQIISKLELTPDPSLTGALAFSMLDRFIDHTNGQSDDAKQEQQELTRILWRITLENEFANLADHEDEFDLDIEPILQKQKKRGNGWTKGRSLSVDTMQDNANLPLTPTDLNVLRARKRTYGYYGGHEWDFIEALNALMGYEHVELNGAPTAIHSKPSTTGSSNSKQACNNRPISGPR